MSNRKLVILGVVTVVMIIWAVAQWRISSKPKGWINVPTYLIQGLDPADIGSIVLGTGEDAVTLKRVGRGFVVTNKDNYPAVTRKINELITSCLDIRTIEFYTDDKANHKALGVTEEDAQTVVKFFRGDSSLLTGVVIGKAKEQGQGTFVRLVSDDKVYVTLQPPWINERAMNYIDQELIKIDDEDIQTVTVSTDNEVYILKKENGHITLEDLPSGKKLKGDVAERVFTALTSLRFNDVKKADASCDLNFNRQYVCKLKDSTVYTIKIAQKPTHPAGGDDKTYITCDAQFTDKIPTVAGSEEQAKQNHAKLLLCDKAKEFSARHRGWIYQIPQWKAKNLTKKLSELLEDEEEPKQVAEVNEPNEVAEEQ